MRIVFIGCVEIGFKCLKQILKEGWNVAAVFTLAKKYSKKTSGFVDFSSITRKHRIALYKVRNINKQKHVDRIKKIAPDLIIISGWQRLVCKDILDVPKKGAIGFHSSFQLH